MKLIRSLSWRSLIYTGDEIFRLYQSSEGFELSGSVMLAPESKPFSVKYQVFCDTNWCTRSASIEVKEGCNSRKLQIDVDHEQRWSLNGVEDERLRGYLDVDLSVTPATNTLPVRRLKLQIDDTQELSAAWVRFPQLEVAPLEQRYTRLEERLYRYESRSGDFSALVEVDDLGLVVEYEGIWIRRGKG